MRYGWICDVLLEDERMLPSFLARAAAVQDDVSVQK